MRPDNPLASRYKDSRKSNVNQMRGLLSEYGIVLPKTIIQFDRHIPEILDDTDNGLTPIARGALTQLHERHQSLSKKIDQADLTLKQMAKAHPIARILMQLRGIGPITSVALIACIGSGHQFKNPRQLAAWIGLVPKQNGSGGERYV